MTYAADHLPARLLSRPLAVGLALAGLLLACLAAPRAAAQQGVFVPPERLNLDGVQQCRAIERDLLVNRISGFNWLIGDEIDIYGSAATNVVMRRLSQPFEEVRCYSQFGPGGERVFVLAPNSGTCGWVDRADLLPENRIAGLAGPRGAVCETPRALLLSEFCARAQALPGSRLDDLCTGVPRNLRTKGVLVGTAIEGDSVVEYPLYTAPAGGRELPARPFFAIVEVHDIAPGADGTPMVLIGDGAGAVYGWMSLDGLRLWPTRLGLYFDRLARGGIFVTYADMVANWRTGQPAPNFTSTPDQTALHLDGDQALVSYPIIGTVFAEETPLIPDGNPDHHEVIVIGGDLTEFGQAGARIEALQQANIAIVMDTTESMVPYLDVVTEGVADFVGSYADLRQQFPDLAAARVGVFAYSDFTTESRETIRGTFLMPPVQLDAGTDVTQFLARIRTHAGLTDPVGSFYEASLETVARVADLFGRPDQNWFPDGPRFVLHIADHGSRPDAELGSLVAQLADRNIYYLPIRAVTDPQGQPARTRAAQAFSEQAVLALRPALGAAAAQVARQFEVDLEAPAPARQVQTAMTTAIVGIQAALDRRESAVTGLEGYGAQGLGDGGGGDANLTAAVRAAANLRLDERLLRQFGIAAQEATDAAIVERGFAPLTRQQGGVEAPVGWTYTVALEEPQLAFLQVKFSRLCDIVGRPQAAPEFSRLVLELARAFSGDDPDTPEEFRAILSDLRGLPGVEGSFLSRPLSDLRQLALSTDPARVERFRRDVCWVSYHFDQAVAGRFVRPDQLAWNRDAQIWQLQSGDAMARDLDFAFLGAETYYLPSWMFVPPQEASVQQGECDFATDPLCLNVQ